MMNNNMYTSQAQPPQAMPLQMHQLPSLGQGDYPHHSVAQQHPTMSLPPPQSFGDQQYGAQHGAQDQMPTPTTPAQESKPTPTPEQQAATMKALQPVVGKEGARTFRLDVVQQPKRARMCGFGDKDRRPITPPPCVRLIVTDAQTGKEVDCNEIDHSMYVINVDLWSDDALREVNLVRHTTTTPSISSTTPASFEQIDNASPAFANILPSNRDSAYGAPHAVFAPPTVNPYAASNPYGQVAQYGMPPNGYGAPSPYYPPTGEFRPDLQQHPGVPQLPSQGPGMPYGGPRGMYGPQDPLNLAQRLPLGGAAQPQGMFTRNLIGSLAASAFRLTDPQDKIGIWFILQDLSVRTEGNFRLRFSFVNVGPMSRGATSPSINQSASINTGSSPVLASCYSEVFTVYSAKKFPGVCESTALSKCFATQGIKIPIRKEGAGNKGNANDDDEYE